MAHAHRGSSVATYILIALTLGVITYVEFAIVEYEIAWLTDNWTIFWLLALSVAKFVLVVAFFMHLKDDESIYSGFFGSGMMLALATFVVMALLFSVRSAYVLVGDEEAQMEIVSEEAHPTFETGIEEDEAAAAALVDARPRAEQLISPPPAARALPPQAPAVEAEGAFELLGEPALLAPTEEGAAAAEEPAEVEEAAAEPEPGQDEAFLAQAEDEEEEEAEVAEAEAEPAAAPADFDRELGEQVYASNCAACHQATGLGVPGAFPPLAGNMLRLLAADGGREYLISVLLYGLQGPIEVDGTTFSGVMPAWAQLSDEQIAAVLNHELTFWSEAEELEGFVPITPEQVAEMRGLDLSPTEVNELRSELALP